MGRDGQTEEYRYERILAELGLLSSHRRQTLLTVLSDASTHVSLHTLVDAFGETEEDIGVSLHHIDLPKFDDVGLIRYDHDEHQVRVNPPLYGVYNCLTELKARVE